MDGIMSHTRAGGVDMDTGMDGHSKHHETMLELGFLQPHLYPSHLQSIIRLFVLFVLLISHPHLHSP